MISISGITPTSHINMFQLTDAMATLGAGVLSAGSSALAMGMSSRGQRETNAANLAIAREQMAFQERMANTVHQREVKDLKLAGLNPVLSATGGHGAPSPSGAGATMGNPYENLGGQVTNSALAVKDILTGIAKLKSEIKVNDANVDTQKKTQDLLDQQTEKARHEAIVASSHSAQAVNDMLVEALYGEKLALFRKTGMDKFSLAVPLLDKPVKNQPKGKSVLNDFEKSLRHGLFPKMYTDRKFNK